MPRKNKRGQNEGSIRQRKDGTFEARYTIGKNTQGKQIQKSIYGKTKAEVREQLNTILHELSTGQYVEPVKITFGEWLDTWFSEYISNSIKLSTKVSYDLYITKHIKPVIGHVQLKDLRADTFQKFYNEKLLSGRLDGKGGLNPKTIKNMHNMIHAALEQALKNNMIARNISESVVLPKAIKQEMRVLSPKEQQKLLDIARENRLGMAIVLDLATGLRLGELLALQWKDIDMKTGILTVRRSINRLKSFENNDGNKTSIVISDPKTKSSKRQIPLQNIILAELRIYKAKQTKEKKAALNKYQSNDYIFASLFGEPIEPRTFQDVFYGITEKAGIENANFHCLRHTFATRALEAGIPAKTVSEILGHANISTTLDLYSHVSLDLKKESMEKLSELFTINPVEQQKNEAETVKNNIIKIG